MAFAALFYGLVAHGADRPNEEPLVDAQVERLERTEQRLSREVINLGRAMDNFFSGRYPDVDEDASILRVGVTTLFQDGGRIDFDPIFSGDLKLPNTQRNLRLVFESDRDEAYTDDRNDGSAESFREDEDQRGGTAKLQLESEPELDLRWKGELGLKWGWPLDPFVRGVVEAPIVTRHWEWRPSASIYAYAERGAGANVSLRANRPLAPGFSFATDTAASYWQDERTWYYSQDFLLTQVLASERAIRYQLGFRGDSEPNDRLNTVFLNMRWRNLAYSDWLFVETKPELRFESEDDFEPEARLYITLEALFGDPERRD